MLCCGHLVAIVIVMSSIIPSGVCSCERCGLSCCMLQREKRYFGALRRCCQGSASYFTGKPDALLPLALFEDEMKLNS